MLTAQEQHFFQRISVFVGGATLAAVEAVCEALCDETGRVSDGLASLMDKSLVQQQAQRDEEPRVAMLKTIREMGEAFTCGGEAHANTGPQGTPASSNSRTGLSGARRSLVSVSTSSAKLAMRSALVAKSGLAQQLALRLSGALSPFWEIHGYVSEGWHWIERALDASEQVRSAVRAKAPSVRPALATMRDDFAQAEVLCAEGLALYRELGERRGSATALSRWGYAAMMRSNYTQACALLEEALALFREVSDPGACFPVALVRCCFMASIHRAGAVTSTWCSPGREAMSRVRRSHSRSWG